MAQSPLVATYLALTQSSPKIEVQTALQQLINGEEHFNQAQHFSDALSQYPLPVYLPRTNRILRRL